MGQLTFLLSVNEQRWLNTRMYLLSNCILINYMVKWSKIISSFSGDVKIIYSWMLEFRKYIPIAYFWFCNIPIAHYWNGHVSVYCKDKESKVLSAANHWNIEIVFLLSYLVSVDIVFIQIWVSTFMAFPCKKSPKLSSI